MTKREKKDSQFKEGIINGIDENDYLKRFNSVFCNRNEKIYLSGGELLMIK